MMFYRKRFRKEDHCTACGKPIDGASSFEPPKKGPKVGDWSVCIYCANVMTWGPDMRLRALTDEEKTQAAANMTLQFYKRAVEETIAEKTRAKPN